MLKLFSFSKIKFLSFVLTLPAFGSSQVIRTIATTNTNNSVSYIQIYEYDSVDAQPQFPGGSMALMKFINSERHYPHEAYERGIAGRVVCGFVVNVDGSISNVAVLKSVEESLDKEALRIIASMPPWISGQINESPVPVFCTLAIPFRH